MGDPRRRNPDPAQYLADKAADDEFQAGLDEIEAALAAGEVDDDADDGVDEIDLALARGAQDIAPEAPAAPAPPRPKPARSLMASDEAARLGAANTASMGYADEAHGLGRKAAAIREFLSRAEQHPAPVHAVTGENLSDLPLARLAQAMRLKTPRTTRRGVDAPLSGKTDYEVGRDEWLAREDRARAERPGDFLRGQAVGAVTTAAAPLPGASALGRGVAHMTPRTARAVTAGTTGALLGGANAGGESRGETIGDVAGDVAIGAGIGGVAGPVVGEAVPAAMQGARSVSRAASAADEWLADKAARLRFGATGVYAHQADALMRERGPEYIRALGEHAEKLKGGSRIPWNARKYRDAAEASTKEIGASIDANLRAAEEAGARVPTDPIADAMEARARGYGGPLGTSVSDSQRKLVEREAARLRTPQEPATPLAPTRSSGPEIDPMTLTPQTRPVRDALGTTVGVEEAASPTVRAPNVHPAGADYDPMTLSPRVHDPRTLTPREAMEQKKAYERLAGYRGDRIAKLPEGATPEVYDDLSAAMREGLYEAMDATPVGPEFRANMQDYGRSNTILNAANKRVVHDDANQLVSLPSAVLASGGLAMSGPHGLAAGAGMGLMKGYGKDVSASFVRGAQRAAAAVPKAERALTAAGDAVERAATTEIQVPEPLRGAADWLRRSLGMQATLPATSARASGASVSSLAASGGKRPDTLVRQLAEKNPDALGEFGPQLADAAQQSEERFASEYWRLLETEPRFQTLVNKQEDR